jgi:amino acid transporter
MSDSSTKLGFQATWSMAVGGMVGGGIFSTLGVVIEIAGAWAWMSFVVAGLIALCAGYAYSRLAAAYGEGGGAFTFLREMHHRELAGSLVWILILGYVLTNAVYAFTFGEYLGHVLGLGAIGARISAAAILLAFIGLNLRGTGEAGGVEVFLVWFKLVVLVGLAGFGLARWNPSALALEGADGGPLSALVGAAAVFMAYEGFQLLTYDYEEIDEPDRTLPRAILSAIVTVIVVYVLVCLGTAMLIGAPAVVANQEVALSVAGREALGTTGLVIVTTAAAFSTGSAINATLFATARLATSVAEAGELPAGLEHRNARGVPDRAVVSLGGLALLFAVVGSLASLVESASLTFLFTFAVVSFLAFRAHIGSRVVSALGTVGAAAATCTLAIRLAQRDPAPLAVLVVLMAVAVVGRPWLRRHFADHHSA